MLKKIGSHSARDYPMGMVDEVEFRSLISAVFTALIELWSCKMFDWSCYVDQKL